MSGNLNNYLLYHFYETFISLAHAETCPDIDMTWHDECDNSYVKGTMNNAQDVIKQRAISSILTLTLERIHCVFHKFTLTDRVKDMRIWHPVRGEIGLGNLDRTSK